MSRAWFQACIAAVVSQVTAFGQENPDSHVGGYLPSSLHAVPGLPGGHVAGGAPAVRCRGSSDMHFALLSLRKYYAWWVLQCYLKCCLLTLF